MNLPNEYDKIARQFEHPARGKNKTRIEAGFKDSAQEWIRTITPLQALRPEHSASTNFATWAGETFGLKASCFCIRAANISCLS